MTKPTGNRISFYMTDRVKKMMDELCEIHKENRSQLFEAMVLREYYDKTPITSAILERHTLPKE